MAQTRTSGSLSRALISPIRRILDPRFDDLRRRLTDTRQSVHDEGMATRVAVGSLTENVSHVVGGYAETNLESLTHLGIELRQLQESVETLGGAVDGMSESMGDRVYVDRLDRAVRGGLAALDGAAASLVNHANSHVGYAAQAELWLNPPIVLAHGEGTVTWTSTNERIVEQPFAFSTLAALPQGARILDVGSSESTVALSLASLGYDVTALEPRGYPFSHPNLTEAATTIERFTPPADTPYDGILLLSTIEHVGLGFYGEETGSEGADRRALERLGSFLAPGGVIVLTVPYGTAAIDSKERTYDAMTLGELLAGWTVRRREIAERTDERTWRAVPESSGPAVAMVVVTAP